MTTPPSAPAPRAGRVAPWVRWGIVLLAAAFRLWSLDLRPPHFDEGVNGMFTDQMQHTGFYRYDPTNYHGPLHFYILFVFKALMGRSLWALRLPEALAGILTVDWIFRFRRFFGGRVCAWAALGMAVSPAFTFYHRYAIHETWLVFFLMLGCWGIFSLWRDGTRAALWATGLALAGLILTKETYVIHLACLALAANGLVLAEYLWPRARVVERPAWQHWRWSELAAVAGVAVFAVAFFYSGAGFYPRGIAGLVTTFSSWAHKAEIGEGHTKPFVYWCLVFLRNEPWALLGLLVCWWYAAWPAQGGWPLRLLALYAPLTLLAYSIIPYKTPWCVIAIAWPFLFLAAAAVSDLAGRVRRFGPAVSALAGGALLAPSAYLAWDLNFHRYADETQDYVYVHTYDAVGEITGPLYDLAAENPANYHLAGSVLCDSVHPLPWLLGYFSRVSYYTRASKRVPGYDAAFLIVMQSRVSETEAQLTGPYFKEQLRLRPSLAPVCLYLREAEFAHLMPGRDPEFRGAD